MMTEYFEGLIQESEKDKMFHNAMDQEWVQYKESFLEGYFKEISQLSKHFPDPKASTESKEQEFDSFDFERRIAEVVNNFHFWLPGGWYRTISVTDLENKKDKNNVDEERLTFNRRLVADLDDILRDEGYTDDFITSIVNRQDAEKRTERLHALGMIYLKMREKGYDRRVLSA